MFDVRTLAVSTVRVCRRNYYGYALFFYHTINNWAGQRVHLPNRTLSFTPHHTAFNASGIAVLPILLGA